MVTILSTWKDLSSFPLLKAFHYFKPAPGIGRTSLSKYLISNVTIVSWLVSIVTENKMVVVLMKDFIFYNMANKISPVSLQKAATDRGGTLHAAMFSCKVYI